MSFFGFFDTHFCHYKPDLKFKKLVQWYNNNIDPNLQHTIPTSVSHICSMRNSWVWPLTKNLLKESLEVIFYADSSIILRFYSKERKNKTANAFSLIGFTMNDKRVLWPLLDNCLMTTWWLTDDFMATVRQKADDCLVTAWDLFYDYLTNSKMISWQKLT